MNEILAAILFLVGSAFVLIAAIGLVRLPDVLIRMHAATKAGALGAGLVVLSVGFYYGDVGTVTRSIAALAFVIFTAPIAAHLIGRTAYFIGVPLSEKTVRDELRGQYDPDSHRLGPRAGDTANRPPLDD